MSYVCNRLLYTQANITGEAIFVGPLVTRLRRGYVLQERLKQERIVRQMGRLTEADILRFGVPRMAMPGDEEDAAGMNVLPAPPIFPPVPLHYAAVRGWGDMQAFQYQLHLEQLHSIKEMRLEMVRIFTPLPPPPPLQDDE